MAVTVTNIPFPSDICRAFDCLWGAAGDVTTGNVAHGLGFTPIFLSLFTTGVNADKTIPPQYCCGVVGSVNFTVLKPNDTANSQGGTCRVFVGRYPFAADGIS